MTGLANTEDHTVLQLKNVNRKFGSDPEIHALVDIDLSLKRGDWLCITGPSGAGKSTLLNVLGCLDSPTSGHYLIDGIDTKNLTDKQLAGIRSQKIGFVFQSFHLLPYRTVLENVMLAEVYRNQSDRFRRKRALEALEKVGLSHRVGHNPSKLSGGEKQRVAIARALMGSPTILLCDEPTGNLDSHSSEQIVELLAHLNNEGITIIVVTHDQNVARRIPKRIEMIDGQIKNFVDHSFRRSLPLDLIEEKNNSTQLRSGMGLKDLFNEVLSGVFAKPGRMTLTVLGVAIGLTALVATVGLTRTSANRIITQFDELAATELFVSARPGRATGVVDPAAIPWDAPDRLGRLNGVVAAGTMSKVDVGDLLVSSSPIKDPLNQRNLKLSVYSASPSLFKAVRAKLNSGTFLNTSHSHRSERIAVLGPDAAIRLGVVNLRHLPAISIGDHLFLVAGILDDVARKPELLGAIIIPDGTARKYFGLLGPETVVVETKIGATRLIANQTPYALRPDNLRILKIEIPFNPERLRENVQSNLDSLFILLGGLSLIVGALGIANITLVGVMERKGEIGLRRAIGATRAHIANQFLLESTSIGVLGGIIGASVGILIVVSISAYQTWTPVLDASVPLFAPLIGGGIGLLSGTYPALRAARLQPVDALRG